MDGLRIGNELDEKTKALILRMEKELELRDKELASKNKEINELKNELEYLKGQVLNKNRKIFGQSSEQIDSNQISLFDEAEKCCDIKAVEPTIEEITYKRNKPSSYIRKER